MQQKTLVDAHGFPQNSPVSPGSVPMSEVPWQFGARQHIRTNKIVVSTGYFKNLSVTNAGTVPLSNGTIENYLYNEGTVANVIVSGATINTSIFEGGTINGITSEGGTINNGVFNNGQIGTPQVNGGTINPAVYQTGGTVGVSGSVVYMKTATPTFGTINFNNGLITSFS